MSTNKSYMSERFHDWLEQCPVPWTLDYADKSGNVYSFTNVESENLE